MALGQSCGTERVPFRVGAWATGFCIKAHATGFRFWRRVLRPCIAPPSTGWGIDNTVALTVALSRTPQLKRHRWLLIVVMGFAGSIILSTFFVRQHSVIDALTSLAMAGIICPLVYAPTKPRCRPSKGDGKELAHVPHPHL
jgi:hypothetical protein